MGRHSRKPAKSLSEEAASALDNLKQRGKWRCKQCGLEFLGDVPKAGLCFDCTKDARWQADARIESGVAPRHSKCPTWESLINPGGNWKETIESLKAFLARRGSSIFVLLGPQGTGKTQIGSTAVLETIHKHKPATIVATCHLVSTLKGVINAPTCRGETVWLNRWLYPWLLVIDAYEGHLANQWVDMMLRDLIDERYCHELPTVITSTATARDFGKVLAGSDIVSRAKEAGGIYECKWRSFRE